jgi:hypothetical protein
MEGEESKDGNRSCEEGQLEDEEVEAPSDVKPGLNQVACQFFGSFYNDSSNEVGRELNARSVKCKGARCLLMSGSKSSIVHTHSSYLVTAVNAQKGERQIGDLKMAFRHSAFSPIFFKKYLVLM